MLKRFGVTALICAFIVMPCVAQADVGKITDPETQGEIKELRAMFANLQSVVEGQKKALDGANKTIGALQAELADVKSRPVQVIQAPVRTAPTTPVVGAGETACGAGTEKLTIGGYAQFDYHAGDPVKTTSSINTFDIRRLYLDFRGVVSDNLDYRLFLQMPSSTSNMNVSVLEAYVTLKNIDLGSLATGDVEGIYNPDASYLNMRLGAQRVPFGLEGTGSSSQLSLVERASLDVLTQGYQLGLSFFGDFFEKRLTYSVGVYNDGYQNGYSAEDTGDNKLVAARITALPLDTDVNGLPLNLKLGGSASYEDVSAGSVPTLPNIDNLSRTAFYGTDMRVGGDAELNFGDFRLRAEVIRALFNGNGIGATDDPLNFDTFSAWGYYIEPSFFVVPEKMQLVYRWEFIEGDEFTAKHLEDVQTHTVGVNYFLTPYQKLVLNYAYMPSTNGNTDENQQSEVLARYQICF